MSSYIEVTAVTQSEIKLQAEIFQYHWNSFPDQRGLLFHVNNKARNAIEGNKMKAMGVVQGVSDLIYLKPGESVIFIELKTENGIQSTAQKQWQQKVELAGYKYFIVKSLTDFKKLL